MFILLIFIFLSFRSLIPVRPSGEMHCPNKYYLEYVDETLVKEAIAHLCSAVYICARVVFINHVSVSINRVFVTSSNNWCAYFHCFFFSASFFSRVAPFFKKKSLLLTNYFVRHLFQSIFMLTPTHLYTVVPRAHPAHFNRNNALLSGLSQRYLPSNSAQALPAPAPIAATPTATSRRRPAYLSHFASTQLLTNWVTSVLFAPTSQALVSSM